MDRALARALKYAPERRAQGALCREKHRERETKREREREGKREGKRAGKRAGRARERSCAMDGALAHALKYVPERRAQSALCREKDRERET